MTMMITMMMTIMMMTTIMMTMMTMTMLMMMKDVYGPPLGRRLVMFIDDMNMPAVDTYGTQQPIAMLKLLVDRGGCYDRGKDLNWKTLKDLDYVAAMGRPGGGRNDVDPRFISLFSVFNMTFPSESSLFHIYNSILAGHVQPFSERIQAMRLGPSSLIVHAQLN